MELDPLLRTLRTSRSGPLGLQDWSVYASETRRVSLGVKDRQAGNAHAPLNLSESAGVRYLFVWSDGRISRGYLERSQVEGEGAQALQEARQAAYEDPDAAWVLGAREIPDVDPVRRIGGTHRRRRSRADRASVGSHSQTPGCERSPHLERVVLRFASAGPPGLLTRNGGVRTGHLVRLARLARRRDRRRSLDARTRT